MQSSLRNIVFSFIQSIDLFNFILKNHHRRVAAIAWHIGKEYGLTDGQMNHLILSAALHDIGALSVEERDELVCMDIENPHPHARLGSYMLESFDPFKPLSKILFYHHWPYAYDKNYLSDIGPVPIESYIIHLADRVDIAINQNKPILLQSNQVVSTIMERRGFLFHPAICDAFLKASKSNRFWLDIDNKSMSEILEETSLTELSFEMTMDLLEQLAFTI